jgi:hypothetical protein
LNFAKKSYTFEYISVLSMAFKNPKNHFIRLIVSKNQIPSKDNMFLHGQSFGSPVYLFIQAFTRFIRVIVSKEIILLWIHVKSATKVALEGALYFIEG